MTSRADALIDGAATLDALHPPGAAFALVNRPEDAPLVLTDAWLAEAASGVPMPSRGSMPLLCHARVAMPAALECFERLDVPVTPLPTTYRSAEEAAAGLAALRSRGHKLVFTIPPDPAVVGDDALLVERRVVAAISRKDRLADLCDPRHVPHRTIYSIGALAERRSDPPERPVFVKWGDNPAAGGGSDVRFCGDLTAWSAAIDWIATWQQRVESVVVEDAVDFEATWCLNYAVTGDVVKYLGAAEQLFAAPARQDGSLIDRDRPPPDSAVAIGLDISRAAQARGYRGVAGYDMGVDRVGNVWCVDLNFRLNASTVPLLASRSWAMPPAGGVAMTCTVSAKLPLAAALARIADLLESRRVRPARLYDGSGHASGQAPSVITAILLAGSRRAGFALRHELRARFAD